MDEQAPQDATYNLSSAAYATIALHAAKHPTVLTGLLVGTHAGGAVTVTQALPLTHSDLATHTTPLLETALHLGAAHAAQRGARLVGAYYAPANPADTGLGVAPTRLADVLRASFAHAVLLVVDAPLLAPARRVERHCFRVFAKRRSSHGTWGRAARPGECVAVDKDALRLVDRMLGDVRPPDVADFEDHCLDPRLDWLNSRLPARLEQMADA